MQCWSEAQAAACIFWTFRVKFYAMHMQNHFLQRPGLLTQRPDGQVIWHAPVGTTACFRALQGKAALGITCLKMQPLCIPHETVGLHSAAACWAQQTVKSFSHK